MEVKPQYAPVGDFFKYQPIYRVPAYQRAYSWDQEEIEDFVRDLETCYNKRKYADPVIHFFGQIVCIEIELQGTGGNKSYELVDGQQRIATFILLVSALIDVYRKILANDIGSDIHLGNERGILEGRIQSLTQRYIVFQKEIQESFQEINVLELSNRDISFFQSFIRDQTTQPDKASHALILSAYNMIADKIRVLIGSSNLRDRIGNLKMIEQILETDFCILNMVASDNKAAFKLFQVLNNRGKNLTEGDLLRAECLRMLEPHRNEQQIVEEAWDNILMDLPADTVEYLKAIYGAHTGNRPNSNSLFNEFITQFLPEYEHEHINQATSIDIKRKVKEIENDINILRKLSIGDWPTTRRQPIEHWDCSKLYLLIQALDHKECLPLLLSAQLLSQVLFRDIVQMLERFVFRYLIIGKQYIGDLLTVYHEEAKIIRDYPTGYTIGSLQAKLQPLMDRVDDEMFKRQLDDFKYTRSGRSNKPLKYFLLSIEYYCRWYNIDAAAPPVCMNKEHVYDFIDSTIEHVYPHNGIGTPPIVDPNLDPIKNTIGNLTILGNEDNRTGDNDDFVTKKPIFEQSSLMINRLDIAQKADWNQQVVENRTGELKNMACAIFRL